MTHHFATRLGPKDGFKPRVPADAGRLYVAELDSLLRSGHGRTAGRVEAVLRSHGRNASVRSRDLLRLAAAVYCADLMTPRRQSYDRWTRHIRLYLALEEPDPWQAEGEALTRLLRFLTGDHWELDVRPGNPEPWPASPEDDDPRGFDTVCLFSGGLDSFVGALDLLSREQRAVLVGHYARGSGATSVSQAAVGEIVQDRYGSAHAPLLRYFVSPPRQPGRDRENTTRGRSLMFLALGVVTAEAFGARRLVVAENGLISLNVPLTSTRLGSLSTRTTHPHFIDMFRGLLRAVGLEVELELPYRFKTKGEMLRECSEPDLLMEGLPSTISCAHPEAMRFAGAPNTHCGYCLACMIRRAAVEAAGLKDPTRYVYPDPSSLSGKSAVDLKVLRLALARYAKKPPRMADLLRAGPLPGTDDERMQLLGVYRRGIDELRAFLASQGL